MTYGISVICRKLLQMQNIIEITDLVGKMIENKIIIPPKVNRIWGADYMLMDSNTFMGGTDGSQYESIIEIYLNIWNKYNYQFL
jgi:hypothetical protein